MTALLIVLTLAIAFLAIAEEEGDRFYKSYVYWGAAVVLVLFASMRAGDFGRDTANYEYNFMNPDARRLEMREPTFTLLVMCLRLFTDDPHVLFFVYALLGVGIKLLALRRLSPLFFLPLAIYMGNYYMLHELTQMRAGVAAALFLFAIPYLAQGRRWQAFLWMACAVLFHYSALSLLPLLLFNDKPINKWRRLAMACVVPIGYALYLLNIDILTIFYIPVITDKIIIYQDLRDRGVLGDQINVFNAVFLVKLLVYFYLLYFYETLVHYAKYISLLLKVMGLSIVIFLFFAGLPVVAFRASELYGVVDIVLYSYLFFTLRPLWFGRAIVVVVSLSLFAINVFYVHLLVPGS